MPGDSREVSLPGHPSVVSLSNQGWRGDVNVCEEQEPSTQRTQRSAKDAKGSGEIQVERGARADPSKRVLWQVGGEERTPTFAIAMKYPEAATPRRDRPVQTPRHTGAPAVGFVLRCQPIRLEWLRGCLRPDRLLVGRPNSIRMRRDDADPAAVTTSTLPLLL